MLHISTAPGFIKKIHLGIQVTGIVIADIIQYKPRYFLSIHEYFGTVDTIGIGRAGKPVGSTYGKADTVGTNPDRIYSIDRTRSFQRQRLGQLLVGTAVAVIHHQPGNTGGNPV